MCVSQFSIFPNSLFVNDLLRFTWNPLTFFSFIRIDYLHYSSYFFPDQSWYKIFKRIGYFIKYGFIPSFISLWPYSYLLYSWKQTVKMSTFTILKFFTYTLKNFLLLNECEFFSLCQRSILYITIFFSLLWSFHFIPRFSSIWLSSIYFFNTHITF